VAGAGRAGVDIGADAGLELVDGFCCLGGMLGVDGDADAAVEAGVRVGWSGFGRLVPLLAGRMCLWLWEGVVWWLFVCGAACCMEVGLAC